MKNVKENGITLIALVVTIVVLLILAGISIAMLAGEDGIIRQAQKAKIETIHSEVKEAVIMKYEEYQIELKTTQNTQTFIGFLDDKEYINSEGTVNVKNLTGNKLGLGNGTDNKTDVYKIEMEESYYVLNYYDKDESVPELSLWKSTTANIEEEEEGEEIIFPEAGLYETGTTNMLKSWEELKADEDITIEGTDTLWDIEESLEGDLVISDEISCIGRDEMGLHGMFTNITEVYIPSSVTWIYGGSFSNSQNLKKVVIQDGGLEIIDSSTFYGCHSLESINIPKSVTSIGYGAFSGCEGLTSIKIPNSVTSIGDDAFSGCEGLTNITIPTSVTSIGKGVFCGCTSLISIEVDEKNTVYDSRNNCNAIIKTDTNELVMGCKTTEIPESVVSIGDDAFGRCIGLTSIRIPISVVSIGNNAFCDCNMDLEVIYDGTEEQWNQIDIGYGNNAITKEPESGE